MFGKLLRHEWRANRGLVGLMCGIIALSGLLAGGSLRYMTWSAVKGNQTMMNAYAFVLVATALAIVGCCVLAMYLLAYRFYKSRFTDQGYLMLTLPVTTHQHLWASIVNTVIGVALVSITAVAAAAVAVAGFMSIFEQGKTAELWQFWEDVSVRFGEELGITEGAAFLAIPDLLITFLADLILFMLALTVGSQVEKHPVLCGAGLYIVASELAAGACDLLGRLLENPMLTAASSCVIYGALGTAAYFIMHHIIDKKLKLV